MDNRGNLNNSTINNSNLNNATDDEPLKSSGRGGDAFQTLLPGRHEKSDIRPQNIDIN